MRRKSNKKNLFEAKYRDIFSKNTLNKIKGMSRDSFEKYAGGASLQQLMGKVDTLLNKMSAIDLEHADELEMIAVQIVKDAYPIIDYADIEIDAKIVRPGDASEFRLQNGSVEFDREKESEEEEDGEASPYGDLTKEKQKRRIANGITQGAAVRGAFAFMLYTEYLERIDPQIVEQYKELTKHLMGIYESDEFIAGLLASLTQRGPKGGGQMGESDADYDDDEERWVIRARASTFPLLVHEIVKGLYEIAATEGQGRNRDKNQMIQRAVDKPEHEPHDIQYGRHIYDALNKVFVDHGGEDQRAQYLFLQEVHKLPAEIDEFDEEGFTLVDFVSAALKDELFDDQKQWVKDTIQAIQKDLAADDEDALSEDRKPRKPTEKPRGDVGRKHSSKKHDYGPGFEKYTPKADYRVGTKFHHKDHGTGTITKVEPKSVQDQILEKGATVYVNFPPKEGSTESEKSVKMKVRLIPVDKK